MNKKGLRRLPRFLLAMLAMGFLGTALPAAAKDRAALEADAKKAYSNLVAKVPAAKAASQKAVAVLVFPKVTKAGLGVGGQFGEGAMLRKGKADGYYSTAGASYGLQAGAQQYGYALFFMDQKSLAALTETKGFEIGVGPSVVVVDEGMGKSATTITAQEGVYAFIFSQKGLMAGLGVQGNKITRLDD